MLAPSPNNTKYTLCIRIVLQTFRHKQQFNHIVNKLYGPFVGWHSKVWNVHIITENDPEASWNEIRIRSIMYVHVHDARNKRYDICDFVVDLKQCLFFVGYHLDDESNDQDLSTHVANAISLWKLYLFPFGSNFLCVSVNEKKNSFHFRCHSIALCESA